MSKFMLEPINRYVVIEPVELKEPTPVETEPLVLLPESYVNAKSGQKYYKIVNGNSPIFEKRIGQTVIIDDSMLETVTIEEQTFYMILENYVKAFVVEAKDIEKEEAKKKEALKIQESINKPGKDKNPFGEFGILGVKNGRKKN